MVRCGFVRRSIIDFGQFEHWCQFRPGRWLFTSLHAQHSHRTFCYMNQSQSGLHIRHIFSISFIIVIGNQWISENLFRFIKEIAQTDLIPANQHHSWQMFLETNRVSSTFCFNSTLQNVFMAAIVFHDFYIGWLKFACFQSMQWSSFWFRKNQLKLLLIEHRKVSHTKKTQTCIVIHR